MSRYGAEGPCTLAEAQEDDEQRTVRGDAPESLRDAEAFCASRDRQDERTTAEWIADPVKARQAAEAERDEARAELARNHGTSFTQARDHLRAVESERDELRAEVERLNRGRDLLRGAIGGWRSRAKDAEATVARVEALADEWEAVDLGDPTNVPWPVAEALMHKAAEDLRAVLADPAPVEQHDDATDGGARCHAARDGECHWTLCPQMRDGEPKATGRHCPIDSDDEDGEGA